MFFYKTVGQSIGKGSNATKANNDKSKPNPSKSMDGHPKKATHTLMKATRAVMLINMAHHIHHTETSSDASLPYYDKNRRRHGKMDHNVNITEIQRVVRTPAKERVRYEDINRKELYHFECRGDLAPTNGDVERKQITWKATFDRPIEQLIYPSLQRFNNIEYDEHKKIQSRYGDKSDISFVSYESPSKQFDTGIEIYAADLMLCFKRILTLFGCKTVEFLFW